MLSDVQAAELRAVFQAQHDILKNLNSTLSEIEELLSDAQAQTDQIRELERIMAELEAAEEFLEPEDFDGFDADAILRIYESKHSQIASDLVKINYQNWDQFVKQCQVYCLQSGIDPLIPYESLLSEADLESLRQESQIADWAWDHWDYAFVGASGVLACLTDFLLVRIPVTPESGEYLGQAGSPITAWLKQYNIHNSNDWFAQWARNLEESCKVPYDAMSGLDSNGIAQHISGMAGNSHRFQSLGHDPVLGFVFGVLDIMRGTITGFSYDRLSGNHNWMSIAVSSNYQPVPLIEAILKQIGHLISDVATPQGLPAPFMGLFQAINAGSFGKKDRTVGEIARWMYLNGYDFRHFLVSGITPATIEIVLRAYIMVRHYSEHGETKLNLSGNPKYRTMLLAAHGIATLGNVGKIALMQGNPLAINYSEWIALVRYLLPSLKYWIFDRDQIKLEHLQKINDRGWNELLENGDCLFGRITGINSPLIILGDC